MQSFKRNILRHDFCVINLQDDYDTLTNGSIGVLIDPLFNDGTLISPVLTILQGPLHGSAIVTLDNLIEYTNTAGHHTEDAIIYQVVDGDCVGVATVHITITDSSSPPTSLKSTLLAIRNPDIDLCGIGGLTQVTKYRNGATWKTAIQLFNDVNGTILAPARWYKGNTPEETYPYVRHWNGTAFDDSPYHCTISTP